MAVKIDPLSTSRVARISRDQTTKDLLISSFQNGAVPTSWDDVKGRIDDCRFAARYLQQTNEESF